MFRLSCVIVSVVAALSGLEHCHGADASHKQVREIRVAGRDGSTLQTLALLPDGKVAALVAPGGHGEIHESRAPATSEVRLFDESGTALATWRIEFTAQSIGAGPDGSVFVGGDGRLAKFDAEGKLLASIELPHLKKAVEDKDQLREGALEMQKLYEKSFAESRKQFDEQKAQLEENLKKLKEKDKKELTPAEKRRISRFEEQLRELNGITAGFEIPSVEDLMKQITSRLRIINGVTVTERDLFVVTGESTGFGYSVWRMDHAFQESKQVLSELRGCCGQMDVQAHGDELFVAENCNHRVGRYSRDGERIAAFGRKGDQPEGLGGGLVSLLTGGGKNKAKGDANVPPGFGGCCNPMNLRIGKDGLVYTAESEGIIRCFTTDGKYRGLVGSAKLTGGCKNVAVAVSADASKVYFCDQPGQQIIVLSREKSAAEKVDE
jgi:hypothetical protein